MILNYDILGNGFLLIQSTKWRTWSKLCDFTAKRKTEIR